MNKKILLAFKLIKTKRRITFDILDQDMQFCGESDDKYLTFRSSNGIEVISRSRMDVQTDRLWLLGCGPDERSGSMVFSSDEKRDKMFDLFLEALDEWANHMIKTYYPPHSYIEWEVSDTFGYTISAFYNKEK